MKKYITLLLIIDMKTGNVSTEKAYVDHDLAYKVCQEYNEKYSGSGIYHYLEVVEVV